MNAVFLPSLPSLVPKKILLPMILAPRGCVDATFNPSATPRGIAALFAGYVLSGPSPSASCLWGAGPGWSLVFAGRHSTRAKRRCAM